MKILPIPFASIVNVPGSPSYGSPSGPPALSVLPPSGDPSINVKVPLVPSRTPDVSILNAKVESTLAALSSVVSPITSYLAGAAVANVVASVAAVANVVAAVARVSPEPPPEPEPEPLDAWVVAAVALVPKVAKVPGIVPRVAKVVAAVAAVADLATCFVNTQPPTVNSKEPSIISAGNE